MNALRCLVLVILYLSASNLGAAEFTWFTEVRGREGWIEFSQETVGFQNRIHVFPRVGAPYDSAAAPRVTSRDDGVVVTLGIDSRAPGSPASFTQAVISKVISQPYAVSLAYQVNVPRPRGVKIDVLYDGEVLGSRRIDAQIPSQYTVAIKVPVSGAAKAAFLRGEFQVEVAFDLPTANFSSIGINVNESLVARYKIEALKSVVKRSRRSGGKFLFFDWRRTTASTVINQSIREQRDINASRQTGVLTIDPDDSMIARVEQLLGLAPISRDEFVAKHNKAAEQAETAGNYDLAALHREYALKADNPTPTVQTELLEKAFAALSSSEPSMAAFLANGIQFSEGATSSSSRFYGFGETRTDLFTENGYSEMKLTTMIVRYTIAAGPFAMAQASLAQWFGTSTPNQQAATTGLIKAVQEDNMPMVLAALNFNAGTNAVYGLKKETPLIIAAQRCNKDIVKTLLTAGANPFLRDNNMKNAAYYARLSCPDVAALIDSYM